ncbi:MAG: Anaphase-promoting complex, cyclosome, subunit 3, partial [Candidatus Saccharibacteria bacterium]|nr:Anaphase-promoting complex, cyclosome, subunit 3 [Candidatus Saccharibacteria bacterium]
VVVALLLILGLVFRDPLTDLMYRLGILRLDVNAELQKAEDLRNEGSDTKAIASLEKTLQRISNNKDKARVYVALGLTYYDSGNYAKAVEYLKKKREVLPDDRGDAVLLARALWHSGQKDEAKTYYQQAIDDLKKKDLAGGDSEIKQLQLELEQGPQE